MKEITLHNKYFEIYNASDDIISSGGTAEDVLRKVPMVTVDLDGEVSLRGNSNVKILLDGRDSRFGSEIDNIPSSMIDQVEVITSPSAKYDPEGMAGIINIKLKKGAYDGLNGKIKLIKAKELIRQKTRQYAKRQFTWARGHMKSWEMIYSYDLNDLFKKAINKIS